jgi:hypothetical protein
MQSTRVIFSPEIVLQLLGTLKAQFPELDATFYIRQSTDWGVSYDGRRAEPINLPV